jgi:c-di-GMP-binding flagellar brake protein YcgR
MDSKDKRRYRRLRNGVRVIYKIMGEQGESVLPVIDVGGGGIRLLLRDKLKTGELLELGLIMPQDKEPFFILAKVAWQAELPVKTGQEQDMYDTGIEFLKLDIQHRMHLIHYVYEKIKAREL